MKGIVLYASKGGSTREYAQWIAESSGFACTEFSKAPKLADYDAVVIGTCVRANRLLQGSWIKRNWRVLSDKKCLLFTVAGAFKEDPKRTEWVTGSLGPIISAALPHFPLNGRLIMARLPRFERTLMELVAKSMAKKNTEEAAKMVAGYDRVKREDLSPLLQALKA